MLQEQQKKKNLSRSLKKLTQAHKINSYSSSQKKQFKSVQKQLIQNIPNKSKIHLQNLNSSMTNSQRKKSELTSKTQNLKSMFANVLPEIKQRKKQSLSNYQTENQILRNSQISLNTFKRNSIFFQKTNRPRFNGSAKLQFKELKPLKQLTKDDKIQKYLQIRTQFQSVVNTSNNLVVNNQKFHFKAFVQKGNNGVLVKQILKKRWWWHIQQKDSSQINLFWSEWFKKDFTDKMQCLSFQNMKTCFNEYVKNESHSQQKIKSIKMITDQGTFEKMKPRISLRNVNYFKNSLKQQQFYGMEQESVKKVTTNQACIHNHIDGCLQMHSKKLLFKNLYNYLKKKQWDPFIFIPITFYIDKADSSSFNDFIKKYDQVQSQKKQTSIQNIWIVKPGQNSNRGFGITVHRQKDELIDEIRKRLAKNNDNQSFKRSVIVQKYLENCFLINNRKFDIRCYILITTVNGLLKGYWYHDGYIRTSSEEYDLKDISNPMIHLTNDAVQKNNGNYGKYQDYNKMSFNSFKKYISKLKIPQTKFDQAYQQMKLIAYYLIASVSSKIKRKQYTFQLFGLDFMLDETFRVYLIEANSNPCLDTSGLILSKLIRQLVDNVLMTAVDPLFPPPENQLKKAKQNLNKDYFKENKFQLIFTEGVQNKNQNIPFQNQN